MCMKKKKNKKKTEEKTEWDLYKEPSAKSGLELQ